MLERRLGSAIILDAFSNLPVCAIDSTKRTSIHGMHKKVQYRSSRVLGPDGSIFFELCAIGDTMEVRRTIIDHVKNTLGNPITLSEDPEPDGISMAYWLSGKLTFMH